jgi:hypothetical protein
MIRRTLTLCALLLPLLATRAAAQAYGITLNEMVELLRSHVSSARVLELARSRCIHFAPDDAALARLQEAGATAELREALRAPGQCSTLTPAHPAPPPADTTVDEAGARRRKRDQDFVGHGVLRSPFASHGFWIGGGYAGSAARQEGVKGTDIGHGLGIDAGYAVAGHLGVYAHADFDWITKKSRHYDLVTGELGGRFFLNGHRAPTRVYADVGAANFGTTFDDALVGGQTGTVEYTGRAVSGAIGFQSAISPSSHLEISLRGMRGTLTRVTVDGHESALPDGERATVNSLRLYLGLGWHAPSHVGLR